VLGDVDPQGAVADLDFAVTHDPWREEYYVRLARRLRELGRNREATRVLIKGRQLLPASEALRLELAATWLAFAHHHRNTRAPDLAMAAVGRAIEADPKLADAYLLRAELSEQLATDPAVDRGRKARLWENAREDFEAALQLEPGLGAATAGIVRYHKFRGYGYLWEATRKIAGEDGAAARERKHELRRRAMDDFLVATQLAPNAAEVAALRDQLARYARERYDAAERLLELRQFEDARKEARAATHYDPDEPDNWCLVGQIEVGDGCFAAAETAYESALALDRESLRALYELGKLRYGGHDFAGARDLLDRFTRVAKERGFSNTLATQLAVTRGLLERCRERSEKR